MSSELEEIQARIRGLHQEIDQSQRTIKAIDLAPGVDYLGHASQRMSLEASISQDRKELGELELREKYLLDQDAERQKAQDHADRRVRAEESAFWLRRFHTSLAIANGGAFAAIGSKLFDKDVSPAVAAAAWHPMALFAVGMVLSGAIPLAFYFQSLRAAWALACTSALLFTAGLIVALAAVWSMASLAWPWQI